MSSKSQNCTELYFRIISHIQPLMKKLKLKLGLLSFKAKRVAAATFKSVPDYCDVTQYT